MVVSLEGVGGAEPAPLDGALDLVGGGVVVLAFTSYRGALTTAAFGVVIYSVFSREKN